MLIQEGYCWRIGDGQPINIWEDPWLPNAENPRVVTKSGSGLEQATVSGLLKMEDGSPDEDILNDVLDDRLLAQGILLSKSKIPDSCFCWRWGEKGQFSVKSCYRRIVGEQSGEGWLGNLGWTSLWKLELPPKVKSFFWQLEQNFGDEWWTV
ncbi:unnamed protein product [Cuscuta epithymum]|uniref:Reverse transcriptase zinc-binding domain-containing protein n=1 Tax=Cuscuta epithymum TaxID=186058 RepID=A0AAV0FAH7_9ASTE|nr:unnamed protein product [Cuscuta epithymum]